MHLQERQRTYFRGAVALVTALAVGAVPTAAMAEPPVVTGRIFSGAELFLGLYLGQGEVAELFPELWDEVDQYRQNAIPPEQVAAVEREIEEYGARLLSEVERLYPGYLDEFRTEVQSGDHVRAEAAVIDGAYKLIDAIAADMGVPVEQLQPFEVANAFPIIIVVVVAAALAAISLAVVATQLAAALWAVAVVAVARFVAAIRTQVGVRPNYAPSNSLLARDVWVDWIATRLAV